MKDIPNETPLAFSAWAITLHHGEAGATF